MRPLAILLVEDEVTLQKSLERALQHAGAVVFAVRRADDAERLLESEEIDAVLADLGLGEGEPSGIRVLTVARTTRPHALRVLMSGTRSDEVVAAIADSLAEQFLHKPFGLGVVTDIVKDALARRAAAP